MKPKHWTEMLASDLLPSKIIDESAQTIAEISKENKVPYSTTATNARKLIAEGKLEMVWKMGRSRLVPAYRVKK